MKSICLFGLGYIGLPAACLFAAQGYHVVGVDVNEETVRKVNQGELPFEEPGLDELFKKAKAAGRLVASTELDSADVYIVAVPTPIDRETRMADLGYVKEVTEGISSHLRKGNLVILESTVSPGTCEKLLLPILERTNLKEGRDFNLVYCPERAIPGNTIHEMVHNDRLIGSLNKESGVLARELYSCFVKGNLYLTDIRTAEIVKLMENTYRDINIALANEFAQIAEESGVNIWEVIELANKHPRVNILKPGPGVGGHCLAIDPWFLAENSAKSRIILLAREINDAMPYHVLSLTRELIREVKDATICILGVAYKGDVDDTRETPALSFIKLAEKEGFKIKAHDPNVKKFEYELLPLEKAVSDSDCLVLITDHAQFKEINPQEIARLMRNRNLVDARNFLDHEKYEQAGFTVKVLGDGK